MIVVVGLSHRTAPIEVREQLALPKDQISVVLAELLQQPAIAEAMIVSTCNRVEIVASGQSGADLEAVTRAVRQVVSQRAPGVTNHLYAHQGGAAVRHLFRVASSLDSLVVGEPQILGQVKDAYELARGSRSVGSTLNQTVPRAIRTAKRVRSETAIGAGQVSVPSVAVDLARQIFGDLRGRQAALIGSGEMAETVARLLVTGGSELTVVGRNEQRVQDLASRMGGRGRSLEQLRETLIEVDVVVSSTSAPHHIVDASLLSGLRRKRRGRTLFLIDLAVPRDIDPRAENLDSVFVYNVDDLSQIVADTLSSRRREAEQAEAIVEHEVQGYDRWAEASQLTPFIVALRRHVSGVFEAELDKSLRSKLKHLSVEDREALQRMQDAALKKLLHHPSQHLRALAAQRDDRVVDLVAALSELFPLEGEEDSAAEAADDELERADAVAASAATPASSKAQFD